ncbi:MAG: tetratricopeptide repeat protein [Halofilum sp. (in: g-proteobacteria)]|nr:tetratricopeptide repeat protein [Halofilum sp. (in: g-proteobacteria)]
MDGPLDTEGVVEHGIDNEAVAMLWDQAEQARAEGDTDAAIRAIERALDVDPDDAVLWSRLAELRLQTGEARVAENLATRSNSLAAGQRLLRYRNWLIIEAARQQQGDEQGADAARAEIERLRAGR